MKTKKILAVLVVLIMSTGFTTYGQKKSNKNKITVFDVNMHCESCKVKFEKNIAFEKGVKDININLDKKKVCITYDIKKTSEEKLIAAFKKLGYEATVTTNKTCGDEKK